MEVDKNNEECFHEIFEPLAHHLYPDGGPSIDSWPLRKNREVIAASDAKSSIDKLKAWAIRFGLSTKKQCLIVHAACASLPNSNEPQSVGAGSPLVTDCACFCSLVKCLIPGKEGISIEVVTKLLSIEEATSRSKATVLRFLTLAVRNSKLEDRHSLSNMYAVVFDMLKDHQVVPDAFRLLHALTRKKHVKFYRAQRLVQFYQMYKDQHAGACILLLLQLYARYDPVNCGPLFPSSKRLGSAYSLCFKIPDQQWEREFQGEYCQDNDKSNALESIRDACAKGGGEHESQSLVKRQSKRQKTGQAISGNLDWLEHGFEGVHSFSRGRSSRNNQTRQLSSVSELLTDTSMRQLLVLSAHTSHHHGRKSSMCNELSRLRACLPYMLHEEWHPASVQRNGGYSEREQDIDDNESASTDNDDDMIAEKDHAKSKEASRQRVVDALSTTVLHSNSLFPEAGTFVLDEVLPHWDGSEMMGHQLCNYLIPFFSPCGYSELHARVLIHLHPHILYGSAATQHLVLTGALVGLLRQWVKLDWSSLESRLSKRKHKVLQELIRWTDDTIVKATLIAPHDLLLHSTIRFFNEVVHLLVKEGNLVITPSPALMYQLLLSGSPFAVDGACQLLLSNNDAFGMLEKEGREDAGATTDVSDQKVLSDCILWDFKTVLWDSSLKQNEQISTRSVLFADFSSDSLECLEANRFGNGIFCGTGFAGFVNEFCQQKDCSTDQLLSNKALQLDYLAFLKNSKDMDGIVTLMKSFE